MGQYRLIASANRSTDWMLAWEVQQHASFFLSFFPSFFPSISAGQKKKSETYIYAYILTWDSLTSCISTWALWSSPYSASQANEGMRGAVESCIWQYHWSDRTSLIWTDSSASMGGTEQLCACVCVCAWEGLTNAGLKTHMQSPGWIRRKRFQWSNPTS